MRILFLNPLDCSFPGQSDDGGEALGHQRAARDYPSTRMRSQRIHDLLVHQSALFSPIPEPRLSLQVNPRHKGDHGRSSIAKVLVEALALKILHNAGAPLGRDVPSNPAICSDVELDVFGIHHAASLYIEDPLCDWNPRGLNDCVSRIRNTQRQSNLGDRVARAKQPHLLFRYHSWEAQKFLNSGLPLI